MPLSGRSEGLPYSLSRWTDVPAGKWRWFRNCLDQRSMIAIDPRTSIPHAWSLAPAEVLGLVFWTKDPSNLIIDQDLVKPYPIRINVTVTGWHEAEERAPDLENGGRLLAETVRAFGADHVTWRFSPVPVLPPVEVLGRFYRIASYAAEVGLRKVMLSFLQPNDRLPETRDASERCFILTMAASLVRPLGIEVQLCNEDQNTLAGQPFFPNLRTGICVDPRDFGGSSLSTEACGCALMADPFGANEACTLNCTYCYAANSLLAPRRKDTTA